LWVTAILRLAAVSHYSILALLSRLKVWLKVKLSLSLSSSHIVAVDVHLHLFVASALDGGEWSTSCSGRFASREKFRSPLTRWLGRPRERSGRFGEIHTGHPPLDFTRH